jgi:hypothetical protein
MLNPPTSNARRVVSGSFMLALIAFAASACVVETREGYWDRDHNRYWHDHAWVVCDPEHCR